MDESPITIRAVVSMPFDENTYILWRPGRNDCLLVDPGFDPQSIIEILEQNQLTPAAILLTHAHADHIAGNGAIKQLWPECPIVVGHGDASKLTDPVGNLSAGYGFRLVSPPADKTVKAGDILEFAGIRLGVRETPGHSTGHVVFVSEDHSPAIALGGDVLFAGGIGRTDFPGCSFAQLKRSIDEQLFTLPDDTVVYPGHGPSTTIGAEKRSNPFVGLNAHYDG